MIGDHEKGDTSISWEEFSQKMECPELQASLADLHINHNEASINLQGALDSCWSLSLKHVNTIFTFTFICISTYQQIM